MSHAANKTQLKTILDSISGNTMGSTFKFFETKPTKFPAGMLITAAQPPEEFFDTNNNLVTYVYIIRCIFAEEESETAGDKWDAFLDALTAALRTKTNSTFGGSALKVITTTTDPYYSETDYTTAAKVFDVQVEVKMLKSIT